MVETKKDRFFSTKTISPLPSEVDIENLDYVRGWFKDEDINVESNENAFTVSVTQEDLTFTVLGYHNHERCVSKSYVSIFLIKDGNVVMQKPNIKYFDARDMINSISK